MDPFETLEAGGFAVSRRADGLWDIGVMARGVTIDELLVIACRLRWWPRPYRAFLPPPRERVPQRLCGGFDPI